MSVARIVPAITVALLVAASADAQTLQRRPGLWEIQMSGSGEGMEKMPDMHERMAQMPPDQRAKMEEYMKQRGMSFGANSMTTRFCLTPQDVKDEKESADAFLNNRKGRDNQNCTSKTLARSATEVKFSAVCKEDDGEVRQVDGRVYDLSPEHFNMEMTSHSNRKGERKIQQKARWLAADCGNVK
jgi:uncharacterized protein DUF3617